jgi:hypothetical protein
MAFLDNSGDIILDAVLTDLGRMRMADGDFSVNKFALADDEVDYSLYDLNHVSGSAYHDLKIMQTPVLEAFTNNTSVIKSNLMTIDGSALYLPVLKINTAVDAPKTDPVNPGVAGGDSFLVIYDESTRTMMDGTELESASPGASAVKVIGGSNKNYLNGYDPSGDNGRIAVDQGIDSPDISKFRTSFLTAGSMNLVESDYMIEIDGRLGKITDMNGNILPTGPSDDDNMAAYILNSTTVTTMASFASIDPSDVFPTSTPIQGPCGTRIRFKIDVNGTELGGNDNLLDKLGKSLTSGVSTTMFGSNVLAAGSPTYKYVDTMVRVRGMTNGYALDIPVRFLKKTV